MEFKKLRRLFSSSKKVDSANNSPSESDNRKRRSIRILGFAAVLIEFAKKHCKRASSPNQVHSSVPSRSYLSFSCFNGKKLRAETSTLVASSLGLNRIKTRSLRATLEACFSFRNGEATPVVVRSDDLPELNTHQDSADTSNVSPSDTGTPENPKELEPPRYQALLNMTSAPRKCFSGDNKSFSHELNAEGVRPFPLKKPHRSNSWEEVLNHIKAKFNKAKEEVNVDLKFFSEDLLGISTENARNNHELKVITGALMILTLKCTNASSGEFWLHCERIVRELDDKRQELPPGVPKQLHTRLLFILTRCTRLLQFRKEGWRQEEDFVQLSQSRLLSSPYNETSWNRLPSIGSKGVKEAAVSIICRICEEDVPTTHVEDHSKICELADRYDHKGVSVDARLERVALTLINIKNFRLSGRVPRGPDDMLDCFGPKSDQGMTTTSSASSMTPRSPRPNPFELLGGKVTFHDRYDIPLMTALSNIARRAAKAISHDDKSMTILHSCLHDLRVTVDRRYFDALTVETFGTRIEKLIRAKYLQLNEILDDEKVDLSSTVIDEDVLLEDDVERSLRIRSVHLRDRISIDDFEEIKEISRGAFGRVLLAKKRATGDIFAIKVLKKADMIRKNAVERIHAERDILINVRNPFVVRFFYSFTCRENLYLVMEYVKGGDVFSLLKIISLDETVARVYIAEVVLALEYLHSEGVVHRDLKPDNILIAHDGHVKLTDFGLSEVGLIDSTSDLSGSKLPTLEHKSERRDRLGTPDYMAQEILLGTGHGATADWWSVGVILFEFIVGFPPFNADSPQQVFDNIINRRIPWPSDPEMSYEARDLIDRLLTKDPHQRLGARGAAEVKQHIFFKDINWDTLPKQKAPFVPETEDALDTSYFQSRYASDKRSSPTNENGKSCESGSSGCLRNDHNDGVDERCGPAELETNVSENNPFDNFSYKNLGQLACINYDLVSKGQKHGTATTLYPRQQNTFIFETLVERGL
uniref:non-specific serine/threonine protein kinase n=1 Tax=Brassica oleracea TaxID=3712 RepID=A0A3P6GVE7_BRAOL|nr:unnamed protein product [Brassica oleracea]